MGHLLIDSEFHIYRNFHRGVVETETALVSHDLRVCLIRVFFH